MSDKICSKLDEIHDIVNNPLLTQSRELYRRALTNYEKGYYEEALEDIKAAVEKNKTDFISWYLLGQIYLFGAGKFSNVINLDEAENAFFNAAKYIDADIGHSEEANKLASEIYYYLGYTRLVKSNDMLVENKVDESNKKLVEAENASGRAYQISKENILAGYEHAKELHFLGKDDEALNVLEAVIKTEPTFVLKASNDKNFESMWDKIDALIEKLRDEVAHEAIAMVNAIISTAENKIDSLKVEVDKIKFPKKEEFDELAEYINLDKLAKKLDKKISDTESDLRVNKELRGQKKIMLQVYPNSEHLKETIKNYIAEEEKLKSKLAEQENLRDSVKPVLNDLKNDGIRYISKEDFLNICNDCLSSLKSDLLKYEKLESENYLSTLKLYDELEYRNSSNNLADSFTKKAYKKLDLIRFLYSDIVIKNSNSNRAEEQRQIRYAEEEAKEEIKRKKSNKMWGIIHSIIAIGSLISAVPTILDDNVGAGFWLLVGSVAFGMFALVCDMYIKKGISRTLLRIYIITLGLFSLGMFVLGHPWFGIIGAVITFFGTTGWNGEERPEILS